MKQKDYKRLAKIINEFVDQELVISRRLYEAVPNEEDDDAASIAASKAALGGDTSGIRHVPFSPVSSTTQPSIPKDFDVLLDDASGHNIVNHTILKKALHDSYFSYEKGSKLTTLKPSPLLIWGAPGIGKSEGVRQSAIVCAREVAIKQGFGESNFIILDDPDKSDWKTLVERPSDNYYFIDWAAAPEEIKHKIEFGTKKHRAVEGGRIRSYFESKLRIPTANLFLFVDIRVAGIDAKDLLGIPFRVDRIVTDKESGEEVEIPSLSVDRLPILKLLCEARDIHAIIMWDEINQGDNQIQAAMYSIILDRQIGNAKFAPGVGQFAAANNNKIWGGNPLRSALANRFASHYLYLSPAEWVATFEKQLMPVVRNFIVNNPTISFFITESGWQSDYMPMLRGRGKEPSDDLEARKSYMTEEGSPKWPTPRMLLDFNEKALQTREIGNREHLSDEDIIASIELDARGKLGPIWAEKFRAYYEKTVVVDWNVLVTNPNKAARLADDKYKREIIKSLIVDRLKNVFYLKGSPKHAEYKQMLSEVMRALVNTTARELEIAMTATSQARKDLETANPNLTQIQVAEKLADIIEQGTVALPDPKWQQDAERLYQRFVAALLQQVPDIKIKARKATPTTFSAQSTNNSSTTKQNTNISPNTNTTSTSNTSTTPTTLPEKFSKFNSLFEDINTTLTQNTSGGDIQQNTNTPDNTAKRISIIKNIALQACKQIESLNNNSSNNKDNERQIKDIIFRTVLADTQLEKSQKQKLISLLKTTPDSVNALLLLKAFSSKTFNL